MADAAALPVILLAAGAEADRKFAERQHAGPGGNGRQQKLDGERKHGERNQRAAEFPHPVPVPRAARRRHRV
jgi:hypothetical protein